jgi:hypothetical protein
LLIERWRWTMNRHFFSELYRTKLIHRIADYIHHAPQRPVAYWNGNLAALVNHLHPAHHAFRCFHGNATHAAFAKMLLYFENYVDRRRHSESFAYNSERLIDRRDSGLSELHVYHGTGNLNYVSNIFCHNSSALGY